jgi:hypothetical protein
MTIRGVIGRVEWGYFTAAAIHGYTVTRTADTWRLRASVVMADAYKLAQRPLLFVAPTQRGEWRWRVRRYDLAAHTLTAELEPLPDVPLRSA